MAQKLVLVADDDEDNRLILRAILEHSGFGVLTAVHGQEAVSLARAHRPNLVLMDLQMPVMNGWEATRALRAHPDTAGIPVVAFSATDHGSTLHKLQQAGFCGYVKKPYPPRQVLQAIEICLAGVPSGSAWIDLPPASLGPVLS